MAFRTNPAPYQRSKNSTLKIMLILLAALVVVWGFGIVYSFKITGTINDYVKVFNQTATDDAKLVSVNYGIKAIFNVLLAVVLSIVIDVVINLVKQIKTTKKVNIKELGHYVLHNYSYISGIIYALTLPVYTSYYVIIIGSIFATLVCKNVFGGFGKNVFNPAIMARIFVGLCFGSTLGTPEIITTVAKASETTFAVDAVSGSTITSAYNGLGSWLTTDVIGGNTIVLEKTLVSGFSAKDLLLGNYVGALGETFTLVILVLGIVLSILGVINWRTPVFYIGTVALTACGIAICNGLDIGTYVIGHIALGGLAFGAVFMLTDPVTGPTSSYGKTLIAVFAGFMTVLIRIKGGYPEGVMYSIALANLISPAIDYVLKGKTNCKYVLKVSGLAVLIVVAVFANVLVGSSGKVVTHADGVNKATEATLESYLTIEDGQYFAEIKDYTPKTNKVVSTYYFDIEDVDDVLKGAYEIKNSDGSNAGYAYIVQDSHEIVQLAYDADGNIVYSSASTVSCTALVGISNEGKIIGIHYLTTKGASTGGTYYDASVMIASEFSGKSLEDVTSASDKISGCSYSTPFVKKLINDAFAEFNAK